MGNVTVVPKVADVGGIVLKVFSLFDKKACAFANPFYFHYKGEALRAVEDLVARNDSPVAKHPADFALYLVGTWDERSGILSGVTPPEFVEEVSNCVTKS